LADSPDAIELKRRARRRLVGAIALVVFVVIALPIVLDREPKPVSQDLSIQIPSQDAGRFSTRVLPAEPPGTSAPLSAPSANAGARAAPTTEAATESAAAKDAVPEPKGEATAKTEAKAAAKSEPARQPVASAAPKSAAKPPAPAESKTASAETFMVPLGMFSKTDNIKQVRGKAGSAGFKTFTEPVAGTDNVRVRAGPFASRDAAEKARDKLKGAGLDVGAVTAR